MRAEKGVELSPEQLAAAATGVKALMPVAGDRTMLDLIIGNLVEAGFSQLSIVIGEEHDATRDFCRNRGYDARFAIQKEARGTSDAVLSAASLIDPGELFLVVNSDNLYPVESLRRLRAANQPALIAFARKGLISNSNIAPDKIAGFATVEFDDRQQLVQIVEKPNTVAPDSFVSMNAWLFSPVIFDACRAIGPSERGEFEITAAVQFAIDRLHQTFHVVSSDEGVLDISDRADVAAVAALLGSHNQSS